MHDTRASTIGLSLVAGAAFVFVLTAGVDAQRRRGNDNSAFGVPVATNTIVDAPDQYFGKVVTITAGVERMVSKTKRPRARTTRQRFSAAWSKRRASATRRCRSNCKVRHPARWHP